jgi:hypothetical protein
MHMVWGWLRKLDRVRAIGITHVMLNPILGGRDLIPFDKGTSYTSIRMFSRQPRDARCKGVPPT